MAGSFRLSFGVSLHGGVTWSWPRPLLALGRRVATWPRLGSFTGLPLLLLSVTFFCWRLQTEKSFQKKKKKKKINERQRRLAQTFNLFRFQMFDNSEISICGTSVDGKLVYYTHIGWRWCTSGLYNTNRLLNPCVRLIELYDLNVCVPCKLYAQGMWFSTLTLYD